MGVRMTSTQPCILPLTVHEDSAFPEVSIKNLIAKQMAGSSWFNSTKATFQCHIKIQLSIPACSNLHIDSTPKYWSFLLRCTNKIVIRLLCSLKSASAQSSLHIPWIHVFFTPCHPLPLITKLASGKSHPQLLLEDETWNSWTVDAQVFWRWHAGHEMMWLVTDEWCFSCTNQFMQNRQKMMRRWDAFGAFGGWCFKHLQAVLMMMWSPLKCAPGAHKAWVVHQQWYVTYVHQRTVMSWYTWIECTWLYPSVTSVCFTLIPISVQGGFILLTTVSTQSLPPCTGFHWGSLLIAATHFEGLLVCFTEAMELMNIEIHGMTSLNRSSNQWCLWHLIFVILLLYVQTLYYVGSCVGRIILHVQTLASSKPIITRSPKHAKKYGKQVFPQLLWQLH